MAVKELSKKRKAAPVTSAPAKKPRKTSKAEIKAASPPAAEKHTVPNPSDDDEIAFDNDDAAAGSEPEDDQTAALLKGFESSSDDEEPSDAKAITTVPALPDSTALQSQLSAAAASQEQSSQLPGVVYVGRVPHGFYEHQMRAYFSQFGHITRLRLSRNRRTGASKHYAFIEFASGEVARIVAEAMDNYLMFGHILKVKLVPREQVHEELFRGAGSRFKKVPWNRIERFRVQGTDREGWERRVKAEEKRRAEKAAKLRDIGYEFEAPKLREVADVPVKAIENAGVKTGEDGTKELESEALVVTPRVEDTSSADAATVQPVTGSDGASEMSALRESKKSKKSMESKKSKKANKESADGVVDKVTNKPEVTEVPKAVKELEVANEPKAAKKSKAVKEPKAAEEPRAAKGPKAAQEVGKPRKVSRIHAA